MVMRTRQKWVGIIVVSAALLLLSVGPGHTWGGGHGFGGHGFHHSFHHGFGGPRIAIGIGPFWGPYGYAYAYPYAYPYAYAYPPVVSQPSQQLSIQPPSSLPSWYYCDNTKGYYPYVRQCPGGWRPVAPTPP
jgi:hypothetical protein